MDTQLLICTNKLVPGRPGCACSERGALDISGILLKLIQVENLQDTVSVKESRCMGRCGQGPILMIQPGRFVYGPVTEENIVDIFYSHVLKGKPLKKLELDDSWW